MCNIECGITVGGKSVKTKRQLIKLVLQNPVINGVSLSAIIRKPFSYFAKGSSHQIELPVVNDVRTRIIKNKGYIHIPDLKMIA